MIAAIRLDATILLHLDAVDWAISDGIQDLFFGINAPLNHLHIP